MNVHPSEIDNIGAPLPILFPLSDDHLRKLESEITIFITIDRLVLYLFSSTNDLWSANTIR